MKKTVTDEVRVFKKIIWPLIRQDLNRVRWYYLGFIPPALQWWSLELELRRDMNKETR